MSVCKYWKVAIATMSDGVPKRSLDDAFLSSETSQAKKQQESSSPEGAMNSVVESPPPLPDKLSGISVDLCGVCN